LNIFLSRENKAAMAMKTKIPNTLANKKIVFSSCESKHNEVKRLTETSIT